MLRISVFFVFFVNAYFLTSQDLEHPFMCAQYRSDQKYIEGIKQGLLECGQRISEKSKLDNQSKKKIKEAYYQSMATVNSYDTACLLMRKDEISLYLNSILKKLLDANPNLSNTDYKLLILRTTSPNAMNLGDGIIILNLGLLPIMDIEAELAFVIAHELAHNELDHVRKSILQNVELLNDREFQKKLKKYQKLEYNRNKSITELFDKMRSKYAEHSKGNEFQADSLAAVIINNAGYHHVGGVSLIQKLDSADNIFFNHSFDYSNIFRSKNGPFKKEWAVREVSGLEKMEGNISYALPDSLKTHPDCLSRVKNLQQHTKYSDSTLLAKDSVSGLIKKKVMLEVISYLNSIDRLDLSLYYSLQFSTLYPSNTYLIGNISRCLYKLCDAQRNHTFATSVYFPDRYFPEPFNEMLNILYNISYSDMIQIAKEYYTTNEQIILTHKQFNALGRKINSLK